MTKAQEEVWANRLGKRKRLELIVNSRAQALADEQRADASQEIGLQEVILDPAQPEQTVKKSSFFTQDRVSIFHRPATNSFRVLPKGYKKETAITAYNKKAQGKQEQGATSKHDILLCAAPDMVHLHSLMAIKGLPKGEIMRLKVGPHDMQHSQIPVRDTIT